MSGLPALSAFLPTPHASCPDCDVAIPREVDQTDHPVDSPVHALQRELARLEQHLESDDSHQSRPPGWVRVTLPIAMSIGLWFVIIRFISALWA